MSPFDLVIFDCDGTLVDTELLNNQATCDVLIAAGAIGCTLDYCTNNLIGLAASLIWPKIERDFNVTLPSDMTQRFVARAMDLMDTLVRPADGAADVIEAVSKTHKICVASNGERANVIASLEATGLIRFFTPEQIFTAADVPRPKPAPDLFLHAARIMGADPARTLVAEDSVPGATAGVAANMVVYGVTGLAHDPDALAARLLAVGVHKTGLKLAGLQSFLTQIPEQFTA